MEGDWEKMLGKLKVEKRKEPPHAGRFDKAKAGVRLLRPGNLNGSDVAVFMGNIDLTMRRFGATQLVCDDSYFFKNS